METTLVDPYEYEVCMLDLPFFVKLEGFSLRYNMFEFVFKSTFVWLRDRYDSSETTESSGSTW